jgi:hypothetical protein
MRQYSSKPTVRSGNTGIVLAALLGAGVAGYAYSSFGPVETRGDKTAAFSFTKLTPLTVSLIYLCIPYN